LKNILFLITIVLIFSGCAEKKFVIDRTFVNESLSKIILDKSKSKCPLDTNVKLNKNSGDSILNYYEAKKYYKKIQK
jgi:hypothetical protein